MGLDRVEFLWEVERTFAIALEDADLREATTPRRLAQVILRADPARHQAAQPGCLSQRAFYRVRTATIAAGSPLRRGELSPRTPLADAFPGEGRDAAWERLRTALVLRVRPHWAPPSRLGRMAGFRQTRLGDVAVELVARHAARLRSEDAAWTEAQVLEALLQLLQSEQGIDLARYGADHRFLEDMGMY